MNKHIHFTLLAIFATFLVSSGAATLEEFTINFDNWEQFDNQIENCESANCITDDQMETVSGGFLEAKLETGNTGYCGTSGLQKSFVVPSRENIGLVLSVQEAELDNWGGRVGVKTNNEWAITFLSEGGQSKVYDHTNDGLTSDKALYYADISEYAGEEVTFKIATEDTSQEWCNMGDHEQSIDANAMFIVSGIQNGDFTSSESWDTYQTNDVNCESQYNCQSDEKQPLDTNKFSNGQLVLDTAIEESDGGHCGTYGRDQWVYIPKADTVNMNFEASAELDPWGGNLGVMFDDDWVFTFNDSRGEGQKTYEMQERTVDVSEYSGEWTNMKITYQDSSGSWCDMFDHDRKMTVESIGFETSGETGEDANEAPSAALNQQRFSGTVISFDASGTSDPDNAKGSLETRWDWTNDGSWDTPWEPVLQADYEYPEGTSQATAKVKVRDGDGGTDSTTVEVSFGDNSGGDDSSNGGTTGEVQDVVIQDNGWKVINLAQETQKSKFSGCSSSEDGATAYHGDSETGYLQREDLSESGTLTSGQYFIQSTSSTSCTVERVNVSSAATTGETVIQDNGWKVINLAQETQKSKFSGCSSSEDGATAYHGDSETGYLQREDLSESGTLTSGQYFIQSTSSTSCTVNLGGSDGDTGGDDSGDDSGDTSYTSTEDEWCQTNGNGEALSSFRDDVESGCKPVNDLDYEAPSGGVSYYASENGGISCSSSDEAYICEE